MDVVEAGDDVGDRSVDLEIEFHHRLAENVDVRLEQLGLEGDRCAVVLALIAREFRSVTAGAVRAPFAAGKTQCLGRDGGSRLVAARFPAETVRIQVIAAVVDPFRGPRDLADPVTRTVTVPGTRRHPVLQEDPEHRLFHDSRLLVLEPVIPPAQHLLEKAEVGPGSVLHMAPLVGVGADESETWHLESGKQAKDGVGVAVEPATDGEDRTADGAIVLAHRSVTPVGIACLVAHPRFDRAGDVLQPRLPVRPPVLSHDQRVSGERQDAEEGGSPVKVVVEKAATHVVHVVAVAVVGGARRDDGLEFRRLQGSHLKRVETAPRDAEHAHVAGAPGLPGDPGDHLLAVIELLLCVLVAHDAETVTGAGKVDAQAGIAVAGEPCVLRLVSRTCHVALAIGKVLEECGHRIVFRIRG